MPKLVDHEVRRKELAQAVWRVIHRDGLARASVRNVAAEAGLSMGSLRHYFSTHAELLAFAMQLVIDRVLERVAALDLADRSPREQVQHGLSEILPLDADRRAEAEVWLAFTSQALVDPRLRQLHDQQYDQLRDACGQAVQALIHTGHAEADPEVDVATEGLFALVDGLALHAILRPDTVTTEQLTTVLHRHLDSLQRF